MKESCASASKVQSLHLIAAPRVQTGVRHTPLSIAALVILAQLAWLLRTQKVADATRDYSESAESGCMKSTLTESHKRKAFSLVKCY